LVEGTSTDGAGTGKAAIAIDETQIKPTRPAVRIERRNMTFS
jgi:hypothetical protein